VGGDKRVAELVHVSAATGRSVAQPAVIAFLVAFGAFALVGFLQGEKTFFADSANYWELSETFVRDGHFSLLNYANTGLRGYALPLTYHFLRGIGGVFTSSNSQMVVVFNAALLSLIGAVLAPKLARIAWPSTCWSIPRRLAICALILVFWRGYLSYPLSDFPALAVALLALIAISSSTSPPWMFISGAAAGLAMDFRPAYVLLVPILIAFLAGDWLRYRGPRISNLRRASCVALFVAGFVLISLPQSLSQHKQFGDYSPIPGGNELASVQYNQGLQYQRLDAMLGGDFQALLFYTDPHTKGILTNLAGGQVTGTKQYGEIIADHPLTMAGVFVRHIVNGLDQRYSTPYVEHLEDRWNRLARFAGFLLVFLALVRVCWPAARRSLEPARWRYPAALALIVVPTLSSAAVTRFMLPVFLLSAMLAVAPGWPNPIGPVDQGLRRFRMPALLLGAGIAFYAVVWSIVSAATDSLQIVPLG
jgi:hypothetical protein